MSYKSFTQLSEFVENQKESYANLSVWSGISSLFSRMMSVINAVPGNYARTYALIQQIKYDDNGDIQDVTPEERQSVADNVISQAKEALLEIDVDKAQLPRPLTSSLSAKANGIAQVAGTPYIKEFQVFLSGKEVNVTVDLMSSTEAISASGVVNLQVSAMPDDEWELQSNQSKSFVTARIPVLRSGDTITYVTGRRVQGNVGVGVFAKARARGDVYDVEIFFGTQAGSMLTGPSLKYVGLVPTVVGSRKYVDVDLANPTDTLRHNNPDGITLGSVSGPQESRDDGFELKQNVFDAVGTWSQVEVTADLTAADLFDSVLGTLDVQAAINALPSGD